MTEFSLTFGPHRLAGYRTGAGAKLLIVHGGPGVPSPLCLRSPCRLRRRRVRGGELGLTRLRAVRPP